MPTTKKRLNVTLTPILENVLVLLAERDNVPLATKASELIQNAVEIEEDDVLNLVALQRDNKAAKFVSHAKAWSGLI
ncbi:MAG: hypothetical protein PHU71_02020 [Candidatus Gracilibacteria bacterium]|nr:hypothetical protein [Candidatus Gracilibacteria bacterium]